MKILLSGLSLFGLISCTTLTSRQHSDVENQSAPASESIATKAARVPTTDDETDSVSSHESNIEVARTNAKIALDAAILQLQEQLDSDTKVTAKGYQPSKPLDTKEEAKWLGKWRKIELDL